jgi:signal transduction histidine kinase
MKDVRTAGDLPQPHAGAADGGPAIAMRALVTRTLHAAKFAEIGQLAAGIIHEINNPVACILSNTQMLLQALPRLTELARDGAGAGAGAESTALLEDVRGISEDLVVSIELLMSLSRNLKSLAYSARDEPTETDLHECIDAALRVARHELKYRVRVEKDYGAVPKLVAYPGLLIQLFLNLFVNAAQAIEGEGTLRIRTRCDGPCVLIEVADSGRGIAPADLPKIFRPFFTTKPVGKGLGLGLSICKGVINRHGGDIKALSDLFNGTVFQIGIPMRARSEGRQGGQSGAQARTRYGLG